MVSRKTRLMSLLLAILMVVSMLTAFVLPAVADSGVIAYDATKDIYFTSTTDYNAPRGSQYSTYPSSNIYIVADDTDWRGLVAAANAADSAETFEGDTIHFVADIDMKDTHVDPLSYDGSPIFKGTIDGHSKVFKNLLIDFNLSASNKYVALVGSSEGAVIQNLGIESGLINARGDSGSSNEAMVASFIGELRVSGTIRNCWNAATIAAVNASNSSVSGISRAYDGNWGETAPVTVDGCYNIGDVFSNPTASTAGAYAHGISAYNQANGKFYNSFSHSLLNGKATGLIRYNANGKSALYGNIFLTLKGNENAAKAYDVIPSETSDANESSYLLSADAYSTGELAYKLNAGYTEGTGIRTYYTLKDGKTIFGNADNQTLCVTIKKVADADTTYTEYLYINKNENLTVPTYANYTCTVADATVQVVDNMTLTYNLTGIDCSEAEAIVEEIGALDSSLFTAAAAIKAAQDAANAAVAYAEIANPSETDRTNAAAAIADAKSKYEALSDWTMVGAPNYADRLLYADWYTGTTYNIDSEADWLAAVESGKTKNFSGITLNFTDDITMTQVVDPLCNVRFPFAGTIKGNNHVINNLQINTKVCYDPYVGLIGYANNATVENLGIASGKITVTGKFDHEEPMIGSFFGRGTGSTKITHCWNAAEVYVDAVGKGGGVSVSGIGRLQNGTTIDGCFNVGKVTSKQGTAASGLNDWPEWNGHIYNSFSNATIINKSGTAGYLMRQKTWGDTPYQSQDPYPHNNTYAVGGMAFNDVYKNASYDNPLADEASFELAADVYTTGELAYKLNTGYTVGKGTMTYYTMEDGKTVFGTESNQTRKVTFKCNDVNDLVVYYDAGEKITLNYADNVKKYDITEGTATLDGAELTMGTTDLTIQVTLDGMNCTLLKAAMAKYDDKNINYFVTADNGTSLATLFAQADAYIANTVEGATQADVNALTDKINGEMSYAAYPNLPKASEYDTYPDAVNFLIADIADMNYVANYKPRFSAGKVLHFKAEGDKITVPTGAAANSWNGVHASIDGHGVTIEGFDVTSNGWLGNYKGSYIKNVTFADCHLTNAQWNTGVLIDQYQGSSITLENITMKNCSATKGAANGMGLMVGQIEQISTTSFRTAVYKNIAIEECTLKNTVKDDLINTAFLGGTLRCNLTVDGVYLNGNKIEGKLAGTQNGIVFGELKGPNQTLKNIIVVNTTCDAAAVNGGIVAGLFKKDGASAAMSLSNVVAVNNGTCDALVKGDGTGTLTLGNNLYTDAANSSNMAGTLTANSSTVEQITGGEAAYKINAENIATQSGFRMEMLNGAAYPSFDTNGEGLPVAVTFQVDYASVSYEPATADVADVVFFTDSEGNLLVDEQQKAAVTAVAVWADNVWTDKYTTEGTVVKGIPYPKHEAAHVTEITGKSTDGVTHPIKCTFKADNDIDCVYIGTANCTYGDWTIAEGKEPTINAEGEKTRTCDCGYVQTEAVPKLAYFAVTAPTEMVKAGDEVKVTVTLKNNPGVAGVEFDITFDPEMLEYVDSEDTAGLVTGPAIDGKVRVEWLSRDKVTEDFDVATLTFTAKAAGGEALFEVIATDVTDGIDSEVNIPVVTGNASALILPEHEHSYTKLTKGENGKHTAACSFTFEDSEGEYVACPESKAVDCEYDEYTAPSNETEPEDAQHIAKCDCGDEKTEACDTAAENYEPEVVPSTCDQTGTETYTCKCGYKHVDDLELRAHDFKHVAGTETHKCAYEDCGEEENCEYDVVTEPATKDQTGTKTSTCKKACGNVITETLPKVPYFIVTPPTEEVNAGDTVTVTVALGNNPGIAGVTAVVAFDKDVLTFQSAALVGSDAGLGRDNGDGTANLVIAQSANVTGEEAFMTITFLVNDVEDIEETEITVTATEVVDVDGAVLDPEAGKATIQIAGVELGDVNKDGKVSIGDAVLMLRIFNNDESVNELGIAADAADVDRDGDVDLVDIIRMLQFLTGMVDELKPATNA